MKAIIPAAGFGTRFFPASKVVPKELLPVGPRPAIQWIAEEAVAAGADEVVIVTSPGKPQLREYFSVDAAWRGRLAGKSDAEAELDRLEKLSSKIVFAEQREQRGLGHAVLQAAPRCRDAREPVLILLGDALVDGETPASVAMAERSRDSGGASVVGLERVPEERVSRYGIIAGKARTDDPRVYDLTDLVEKPKREEAPSKLAVAGRYLLSPAIFELLASQTPGQGGEIQLTDAIRRLLAFSSVLGYRYPGRRHDIGNPAGYLDCLQSFRV